MDGHRRIQAATWRNRGTLTGGPGNCALTFGHQPPFGVSALPESAHLNRSFRMNPWRKRPALLLGLALCLLPAAAFGDGPARRVPTVDDLLTINALVAARISPDGKWVAYGVTHP